MWSLTLGLVITLFAASPKAPDVSPLAECHRAARARDWKIGGDFEVRLTLTDTGRVNGITMLKNTSQNALLERCVRYHLQNMLFSGHKSPLTLRFSFPRDQPQAGVLAADVPISRVAGNGTAARVLVHPHSVSGATVSLSVVRIEKNGRFPLHLHRNQAVSYFVLEGTGRIDTNPAQGKTTARPLSVGAAGYIPVGILHEFIGPAGEEPLVFLLWSMPAGLEQFFLHGEPSRHDVWLFPPETSSEPRPQVDYTNANQLRHVDRSLPTGEPRQVEKTTWFSLPAVGEWCVITAPPGKSVTLLPPKGSFFSAFVLRGGGEWTSQNQTYVLQPGSGWYFQHKATYTPKIEKVPLFLIAYCGRGTCNIQ